MKNLFFALTLFFMFLLFSCDKHESVDNYKLPKFWDNLLTEDLDSTATVHTLIGNWKLTYVFCCLESTTGGQLRNVEDEDYRISITPEKIYVYEKGTLTQESNWSLDTQNAPAFKIDSNPSVSNTGGQILFSENMVLFYASPSDGPDHYFERVKDL